MMYFSEPIVYKMFRALYLVVGVHKKNATQTSADVGKGEAVSDRSGPLIIAFAHVPCSGPRSRDCSPLELGLPREFHSLICVAVSLPRSLTPETQIRHCRPRGRSIEA